MPRLPRYLFPSQSLLNQRTLSKILLVVAVFVLLVQSQSLLNQRTLSKRQIRESSTARSAKSQSLLNQRTLSKNIKQGEKGMVALVSIAS